eukprot:JP438824.1.p2 GENE.JP438824.1~~JP438824.1.p2  ORF type:complete len:118 (-),score=33.39 JP438824.1:84-437(-)
MGTHTEMGADSVLSVFGAFKEEYKRNTSTRSKVIDCFILYFLAVAALQVVYCAIVGSFPFNSFLAGFISAFGSAILTACLRMQINPANHFEISEERAFADYALCMLVLYVVAINFIG